MSSSFAPAFTAFTPHQAERSTVQGLQSLRRHGALPLSSASPNNIGLFFFLSQAYTIQGQYAIPHPDVSFTLIFLIPFYVTCMLLLVHIILILDNNINSIFSK